MSRGFLLYAVYPDDGLFFTQTFYCRFVLLLRSSLGISGLVSLGPGQILFTCMQIFSLYGIQTEVRKVD